MFSRIVSVARDLLSSSTTSEHEDNRQSSPATDTMVATRRSGELPVRIQSQASSTLSTPVAQSLKRKSPRFSRAKDVSETEIVEDNATPSRAKRRKVDSPKVAPIKGTIFSTEVMPVVEIPAIDLIPASELSNSEDIVEDAEDEELVYSPGEMDDEVVLDANVKLANVKPSTHEIEDSELSEEEPVDEGPEEEIISRSYPTSIPNEEEADEEVKVADQSIELRERAPKSETVEDEVVEEAGKGAISGSAKVAEPILSSSPEAQDITNEVPSEEERDQSTGEDEVAQSREQLEEDEESNQKQSHMSFESSKHTGKDANQATANLPNVSAAKYLRTKLPALLPDDFLKDEDAPALANQPAFGVAKKMKFADVLEVPKTRQIGTTAYKVEKAENPLLAPKSKTAARSTKESWIQHGRSGAKSNPNRKPFSKGFFVSK